jgi:hypothetical protein
MANQLVLVSPISQIISSVFEDEIVHSKPLNGTTIRHMFDKTNRFSDADLKKTNTECVVFHSRKIES